MNREVTLQMVDGKTQTVKVGPGIKLSRVRPGDDVGVRVTRAFAIAVTTPEGAPAAAPAAFHRPRPHPSPPPRPRPR